MSNNKWEATFGDQSELEHAWHTIPAECRAGDPDRVPPAQPQRTPARSPLTIVGHIVTFAVTAAMIGTVALLLAAWFLDWKMP